MLDKLTKAIGTTHNKLVFQRRKKRLAHFLSREMTGCRSVLDVGSGDGSIASLTQQLLGNVRISGVDILVRPEAAIAVEVFDGENIPHGDNSFDAVMIVDVLHHTDNAEALLTEAARVSRDRIVIKDHIAETRVDHLVLRIMDWVGNAPHGVVLPYNYSSYDEWMSCFGRCKFSIDSFETKLSLYSWPFNLIFERKLHFVAQLKVSPGK